MQLTGTRTDLVTLVLYIANYIQFGYIWKWGLLYSFVHQNGNFKGESDDKPICWGNNRFSDTFPFSPGEICRRCDAQLGLTGLQVGDIGGLNH